MKQSINLLKYEGLNELSAEEMKSIEGGSFWEDIAFVIGATVHCFRQFTKQAMQYQHSLPANLKK